MLNLKDMELSLVLLSSSKQDPHPEVLAPDQDPVAENYLFNLLGVADVELEYEDSDIDEAYDST